MGPISAVAYFFLVVLPADFLADFFAGFFIYYHLLSYHSCLIPRFLMRYKKPLAEEDNRGGHKSSAVLGYSDISYSSLFSLHKIYHVDYTLSRGLEELFILSLRERLSLRQEWINK
jgi:hypothetical protein